MAIDYFQTGNMNTVTKLNLTGTKLSTTGGSWKSKPVDTVQGDGQRHDIFKCVNEASNISGPEGTVTYESADGSVFTLHFDCPWNHSNVCDATVSEHSPFKISAGVPAHGADITYSWTITQKDFKQLLDLPVSSVDFIAAPKCDLVPFRKILEYIDGRETICLKDVFAVEELPNKAKIWCATHSLFLTSQSKAILTRELAKRVANKINGVHRIDGLVEEALAYNEKLSQGDICRGQGDELTARMQSLIVPALSAEPMKQENVLLCVIQALVIEDLSAGFKAAVAAYVNNANQNGLEDRTAEVAAIIGEKLCL